MKVSTEALLDKLYNLRGSDSEILKQMDKDKDIAEQTKERTSKEKENLQQEITDLTKKKEELEDQGAKLKDTLQDIHKEDYETVLTSLHIDFDPKSLLVKLENNLPRTIESVERDTKRAEDELVKVEKEMNQAITTIDELGIRKDTALSNQEKLNEYFDLALSGRINITRDSITSLLEEFGFNEEEQRETAKILMFPEDALYSYDERQKEKAKSGKSISDVFHEAETNMQLEEPVVSETTESPVTVEDEFINPAIEEQSFEFNAPTFDPVSTESNEEVNIEEEVINTLNSNGIDYLDFTSDEINDLIQNWNKELVESNINYMKNIGLDVDIFVNHIQMMYDYELQNKVSALLGIGKEALDIYLNPNVLVKYNYNELQNAITLLQSNGMDPKDVPLMAY